ncbi:hypothetical protein AALP_AA2G231300 [Arabis alpina]|uniref:Uncharacterized protein n=1 Tax=Arabis alpina TaxID=50452 RepID=A0A087HJF2_ARAAL|nr:hypothetical protein AALP_AA2G231300 [Arabis alpina]
MIRDFLVGISSVKDMVITSPTLHVIYDYSRAARIYNLFSWYFQRGKEK